MLDKTNIANLLQKDYKQDQNPCLNQLSKPSSHCTAVLPEIKVKRETPCCFTNTECVTVFSTVGVLSSSWRFFGYFHLSRKPKFPSITLYLWWHTYRNKIRYSTMLRKNVSFAKCRENISWIFPAGIPSFFKFSARYCEQSRYCVVCLFSNDNDNEVYSWSQVETKEPGVQHDIIQFLHSL